MTRHLVIFAVTCVFGIIIGIVLRTAMHQPYQQPSPVAAPPSTMPAVDTSTVQPMHASATTAAAGETTPINTRCPICGDPVTPKLPYATYQGKLIGFGCAMCPPLFNANPEKYGPAALKNQVVEE